jgi:hypothetical protein
MLILRSVNRSLKGSPQKQEIALLLGILVAMSACLPTSQVEPTTLAVTPQSGSASTETEYPATIVAQNTPTPVPESGCSVPPGSPPLPDLSASFSWASELQNYLNQGGLVEPLADELASRRGLGDSSADIIRRDLTSDGFEDVLAVLYENGQQGTMTGSLLVFRCDKNSYKLAYSSSPGQNIGPPVLIALQDLNADGVTEIFFSRETCGAHTCFKQVEILRWNRSGFMNLLEGRSDDLPSPSIELIGPLNDGRYQIEITPQGISSVGAGPYRKFTRIWGWSLDQSRFVVLSEQLAPPNYRIHMLHDADDAASAGNLEAALIMYQRVREDGSLDDWIKGEAGHAELAAFATYRQVNILVLLGRIEEAQEALEFLQEAVPEGSPGYGMRQLTESYWQTYSETQDPEASCASAQRFAQQQSVQVLEPLQYGYANRIYTSTEICILPR